MTERRPVLVVTGGSRGIGNAVARQAIERGYDVAVICRVPAEIAPALSAEAERAGACAITVAADVSQQDNVNRAFDRIDHEFGRIDALVTSAGIIGAPRSILEADAAHLREVFETNVLGTFYAVSAAARRMSTQRGGNGGAIVLLSSAAARHGGMPGEAHYASSKGAIDSLTLSLAKELPAHGIRINVVRPGVIRTTIHEEHGGEATIEKAISTIPLGRAGDAQEVADTILYLLGPASTYVHGAVVDVAGGR